MDEMDSDFVDIGLIPFSDHASCEIAPTSDYNAVKSAIKKLQIGKYGYGNDAHPFQIAKKEFGKCEADQFYVIVLTDGQWGCQNEAMKKAKKCHTSNIDVIALGFGYADEIFLQEIASMDSFASLTNLSDLSSSFSKIAQSISDASGGFHS